MKMKIGCIQLNVRFGKVEENFARAEEKIREAASLGAEIIVLPEMWNTGYALEKLAELADTDGERAKAFLQGLAIELGVHIVGALSQRRRAINFTIRCIRLIRKESKLANIVKHIYSV